MFTYTYNLDDDFINGINPTCLDRTIVEYGFPVILDSVNVEYGIDTVTILFEDELSTTDKEDLDTLISVHNPLSTCDLEVTSNQSSIGEGGGVNFTMSDHASHDYVATGIDNWTCIRTFVYAGTSIWTPTKFLIVGSLEKSGITAYARLYDLTNNKEIASISWNELNKGIQITEELNNLPFGLSGIELQIKVSKKGTDARTHYMALY